MNDTLQSDRERRPGLAMLALLLLVPAPSLGTWCAMYWLPDTLLGRGLFFASKAWILALPLIWHLWIDRQRWSWSAPKRGGFFIATLLGLGISAVIYGAYVWWGHMLIDVERVREQAAAMGLDRPLVYLGGAAYWIAINSVLEEYVWRWFVFRKCEVLTGGKIAVLLSGLFFTIHHIFGIAIYMDALTTALCCLGVGIGGVAWSWLYLRYRSIWPAYVSHAIVDVAVFAIGYDMFFG